MLHITFRDRESFVSLLARSDPLKGLKDNVSLLVGQLVEESVAALHFGLSLGPLDICLFKHGLDLRAVSDVMLDDLVPFAWNFTVKGSGHYKTVFRGLRIIEKCK